jgi:hypothetical protein
MNLLPGIGGSLLPSQFLAEGLDEHLIGDVESRRRPLLAWWQRVERECGPASGLRAIFDLVAMPLFGILGFRARHARFDRDQARAWLETRTGAPIGLLVLPWTSRPSARWREAAEIADDAGARWCFVLAPPFLSLVDARPQATRKAQDFRLPQVFAPRSCARFLLMCRPAAFDPAPPGSVVASPPSLDVLLARAAAHQSRVRRDLEHGVLSAIGALSDVLDGRSLAKFDEALTLIYRVLFLLFAESRDLVPRRHPLYAESYAIGALCRDAIGTHATPGLWEALAAITRLSRTGLRDADLIVSPFNGRLFARTAAPSLEPPRPIARATRATARRDAALQRALVALGTRPGRAGRQHIAYGDLGVEELGTVYERVLDVELPGDGGIPASRAAQARASARAMHSQRRKQSGTFYTPQALTEFVVRRTLAPLVAGRSADDILALRVVDPAMGSGAFLVAACHFLAGAYEHALVEDGRAAAGDLDDAERANARRLVAERCLAGVDVNPTAVQLARLSLWLTTLAGGKPLSFLDHRLRHGNSLVGAAPGDLARAHASPRHRTPAALPLFDEPEFEHSMRRVAAPLAELSIRRDDSVEDVRAKEAVWQQLAGGRSPLARWRIACDAWCARWFVNPRWSPQEVRALLDAVLKADATLGAAWTSRALGEAAAAAKAHTFFHWPLEFADVFHDRAGRRRDLGGFDAVIGNPPWEMVREDGGRRRDLVRFIRESGVYEGSGQGHLNLYQPFVERALQLTRPGGRAGLLLPWGLATDDGALALRGRLLDRREIDTLVGFDNAAALFPVHRGVRFMAIVATPGRGVSEMRARFGVRQVAEIEQLPGRDDPLQSSYPIRLSASQIGRIGGPSQRLPDVRRLSDLRLLERLTAAHPALGSPRGWYLRFGRELNATDDRASFGGHGLPVIDGKHIDSFVVDAAGSDRRIDAGEAARLLPDRRHERPRLAYRDVSAATNRLSLIAAVVPGGVVTTHTLFCLRTSLSLARQHFLCGLFNSYVLNAIVRMLMGGHVTTSLVESLPVPVWTGAREQRRIAHLAWRLSRRSATATTTHAALHAAVACLYELDRRAFADLLEGFPLVAREDRDQALSAFDFSDSSGFPHDSPPAQP